jgi:hypothetical protein
MSVAGRKGTINHIHVDIAEGRMRIRAVDRRSAVIVKREASSLLELVRGYARQ